MVTDQRAEYFSDLGLAGAERPTYHQRRFHLDAGLLKNLRPPADDPQKRFLVTPSYIVLQMGQKLRTVAFFRLDGKTLPEIVVTRTNDSARWREFDAVILPALRV